MCNKCQHAKKCVVKVDDRRKDWCEDKCYEEKDYFLLRKYYVKEQKYLVKETKYDDCDKKDKKHYKKSY